MILLVVWDALSLSLSLSLISKNNNRIDTSFWDKGVVTAFE